MRSKPGASTHQANRKKEECVPHVYLLAHGCVFALPYVYAHARDTLYRVVDVMTPLPPLAGALHPRVALARMSNHTNRYIITPMSTPSPD